MFAFLSLPIGKVIVLQSQVDHVTLHLVGTYTIWQKSIYRAAGPLFNKSIMMLNVFH